MASRPTAPAPVAAAASSGGDDEVRPASWPSPAALRRSSARPCQHTELRLNTSGALGRTSRPPAWSGARS
eukprot:4727224-Prymnesium_polylepis.1